MPPTWTPTFTPTATLTFTPTLTPTITPTVPPEEFCASEFVTVVPNSGLSLPYTGTFSALVGANAEDTILLFRLTHRLSGIEATEEYSQPGLVGFEVPVAVLPRSGLYDWQFQLVDADGNVVCDETGHFFAGREAWLTPTVPPTQTPPIVIVTATPASTQTPVIIIVTATPDGFEPTPEPAIRERVTPAQPATAITPDQ